MCKMAMPLALCLFSLRLLSAQAPAGPPLKISNVSQKGPVIAFDLTNVSRKTVRADAVACKLRGANGQTSGDMQQTAVYGLGPEMLAMPFRSGMAHQERFSGIPKDGNGQFDSCALSIDYVLFTDGSAWGPDRRKASVEIHGIISGYDQALIDLQQKLRTNGANVVLQYIRQFKPIR